jgi:hypothetical protein
MPKRTTENCTLIKKAVKKGVGTPDIVNGKCMGYSNGSQDREDDEPCLICMDCKLNTMYGE